MASAVCGEDAEQLDAVAGVHQVAQRRHCTVASRTKYVAIRREDKNLTLTSQATDNVTRVGRWLNGVHVRSDP